MTELFIYLIAFMLVIVDIILSKLKIYTYVAPVSRFFTILGDTKEGFDVSI